MAESDQARFMRLLGDFVDAVGAHRLAVHLVAAESIRIQNNLTRILINGLPFDRLDLKGDADGCAELAGRSDRSGEALTAAASKMGDFILDLKKRN